MHSVWTIFSDTVSSALAGSGIMPPIMQVLNNIASPLLNLFILICPFS